MNRRQVNQLWHILYHDLRLPAKKLECPKCGRTFVTKNLKNTCFSCEKTVSYFKFRERIAIKAYTRKIKAAVRYYNRWFARETFAGTRITTDLYEVALYPTHVVWKLVRWPRLLWPHHLLILLLMYGLLKFGLWISSFF